MTRIVQRSFAGGEIAPELYGQADQDFYQAGAKTLENVLVTKDGSLRKRSGLEYVAELDATTGFRVLRFGAADGSDFVVVLASNGAVQIFRDGVEQSVGTIPAWDSGAFYAPYQLVTRSSTVYYALAWTDLDPLVVGWGTEDPPLRHPFGRSLASIQWAQVGDVLTVTSRAGGIWQLLRTSYGWNARTPEIPDVGRRDLYSGNDIYFAANTIAPSRLENEWHLARDWKWIVTAVVKWDGMWRETGVQETISLSCAMATDFYPRQIIWTKGTSTEERYYRIYRGYNGLYGLVGETSPQPNDACAFWDEGREPDVTQQPPARLGDPSLYSDAPNYPGADESTLKPAALAFWQQRMVLGGFDKGPANLLLSNAGQIQDFLANPLLAPNDDDGIDVALSAVEHEEIRAIMPAADLLVFTSRGEWVVWGEGDAVAPRTLRAKRNSGRGIGNVPPLSIGSHLLFISRSGAIYALAKNGDSGAWDQADLTARASHLFDGHTIVDWAYQQRPDSVVWCVRDDGVLLSLTYRPEAGVVAWAKHTTDGLVRAVGVVDEGDTDTVYCAVRRTTATGPTLERMKDVVRPADIDDGFYFDAARVRDGRNLDAGNYLTIYPIMGSLVADPTNTGNGQWDEVWGWGPAADSRTIRITCWQAGTPGDGICSVIVSVDGGVTWGDPTVLPAARVSLTALGALEETGLSVDAVAGLSNEMHTNDTWALAVIAGQGYSTGSNVAVVSATPTGLAAASLSRGLVEATRGGSTARMEITESVSTSLVKCLLAKTLPAALRYPYGIEDWSLFSDYILGFTGLEGAVVTALADLQVVEDLVVGEDSAVYLPVAAKRVSVGLPYTAKVELLDAYDKAGVRMRELTWMSVRAETAGAPALFATAGADEGGQTQETSSDGVVSRRTVEGTLSHALEEEVAGAIIQTLPYPLRILRVTRDVTFEQNL